MNKEHILQELINLEEIGVDKDKVIIVYGAAMVIHGIKDETNDIDIYCDKNYFNEVLVNKYGLKSLCYKGNDKYQYIKFNEYIDIFNGQYFMVTKPYAVRLSSGWRIQSVGSLMMEKSARAKYRLKDKKDVELIRDFVDNKLKILDYMEGLYVK